MLCAVSATYQLILDLVMDIPRNLGESQDVLPPC